MATVNLFKLFFFKLIHTEFLLQINFLANCQEFSDIQLRVSEKKVLNELNNSKSSACIRYPMKGKIKTSAMKVCRQVTG